MNRRMKGDGWKDITHILPKAFRTMGTFVGTFTGMDPLVLTQDKLGFEGPRTKAAVERPFD